MDKANIVVSICVHIVDAGQGVEAQTLANCYTAIEMDMEVVPILNKIDLPQADPLRVAEEIEDIVGIDALDAVRCSAKTGIGIEDVLEEIVLDGVTYMRDNYETWDA